MIKKHFTPLNNKIWLSSPTMHGEEIEYINEAYRTNWMSTVGKNIDEIESLACERLGCENAVALSSGTSALHLALKLSGVKPGDKVFCSDLTFAATVNPVLYEKAEPIFIDSEYETWNMDPKALERAFDLHPETKVIIVADLYGTPARLDEIARIAEIHGAVIIEDAAESLGAAYKGRPAGSFGLYNAISFNGNKIITGSSGGMLLTDDKVSASRARKWSTQSREDAPWYQHEELGYNYRMSNVIAGVVRGQFPHLEEHIVRKKEIYERYREGFKALPVKMNPYTEGEMEPNFWLSCLTIDESAMCSQIRSDDRAEFIPEEGKSCPTEILESLSSAGIEGRPIWKPMHSQPIYESCAFISAVKEGSAVNVSTDIFNRGICLPSDIKMSVNEQDNVIEIIRACFE